MRSRNGSHPLYRMMLHFYPKTYQREYADQMIQTLQDMLDDTETSMDRMAVWARVIAETPVSVLQENINTIGENSMKKLTSISNKHLAVGGIAVAIIIVVGLFSLKSEAIVSRTANIIYGKSLSSLVVDQNSKLSDPFTKLADHAPKPDTRCFVGPKNNIRMHVECDSTANEYIKLGQSATDRARIIKAAQEITDALKAEGYEGGYNGVTFLGLVSGTYEGKDYSPDAFYYKVIGKNTCVFDTTVAYSNPAQPATNMSLNCIKTFDLFGKPSGQPFDSSKGYSYPDL